MYSSRRVYYETQGVVNSHQSKLKPARTFNMHTPVALLARANERVSITFASCLYYAKHIKYSITMPELYELGK